MGIYNITDFDKISITATDLKNNVVASVCSLDTNYLIWWIIIPLTLIVILLFLIRYKDVGINWWHKYRGNKGAVKIHYRMPNKKIIEKLISLDSYNTFKWGKRRYTLDKMHDFIFGYDKNNVPVFLYDYNFIMPMKLTSTKIKEQLRKKLSEMSNDKNPDMITDKQISQLTLKIDSSILETVYSKKLLSDLYSISGDSDFRQKLIWIGMGLAGLVILYYTGLLATILGFLGIQGVL